LLVLSTWIVCDFTSLLQ